MSGVIRSSLTGLKPVSRGEDITSHRLFDVLFPDPDTHRTYAFIDAARIPDLEARLALHSEKAICLAEGPGNAHLAWALPWLIEVKPGDKLLRHLLSDQSPSGLWDSEVGLFFVTPMEPVKLMRHLRKFHRPIVDKGATPIFLRFWEPELLLGMVEMECGHIRALPKPDLRIVARFEDEAHILTAQQESSIRPGRLTLEEADAIGKLLIGRRRRGIAQRIAETFPDAISHLSPRALEREVHDAWLAANHFGLQDGEVRAKFIIMCVAMVPGLHREPRIERLFAGSTNPDRSFRELDQVIQRRVGSVSAEEVA